MTPLESILISAVAGVVGAAATDFALRRLLPRKIVVNTHDTFTRLNTEQNAMVEQTLHWRPIETCPQGVTLWLLGAGNVSFKGQYRKGDDFVKGWFPMPNIPEDMK